MKRGFYILLVLVTVMAGISCNKTRSYTDMLKDQEKAIGNFMAEKGFYTISDYPSNGEFKEGQFIQMNGLYVHVIDSGRGERVDADTRVLCRVKGHHLLGDTTHFDLFRVGTDPIEFTFGRSYNDAEILSEGLLMPLTFLRDSAIVSLIIPFQIGSYNAQSAGVPLYLERVRYIFYK